MLKDQSLGIPSRRFKDSTVNLVFVPGNYPSVHDRASHISKCHFTARQKATRNHLNMDGPRQEFMKKERQAPIDLKRIEKVGGLRYEMRCSINWSPDLVLSLGSITANIHVTHFSVLSITLTWIAYYGVRVGPENVVISAVA